MSLQSIYFREHVDEFFMITVTEKFILRIRLKLAKRKNGYRVDVLLDFPFTSSLERSHLNSKSHTLSSRSHSSTQNIRAPGENAFMIFYIIINFSEIKMLRAPQMSRVGMHIHAIAVNSCRPSAHRRCECRCAHPLSVFRRKSVAFQWRSDCIHSTGENGECAICHNTATVCPQILKAHSR